MSPLEMSTSKPFGLPEPRKRDEALPKGPLEALPSDSEERENWKVFRTWSLGRTLPGQTGIAKEKKKGSRVTPPFCLGDIHGPTSC